MTDDNPYDLLGDDNDDGQRWAFGTGFTDALAGMDTTVPPDVEPAALARYCLALGDDALVYSHRLQQWITRMPELEEETALANVALDLLGQARMLLARAGGILDRSEDDLAFFRTEGEFRNVRLVERADRDFAELMARLLVFSTWRLALFESLATAADPVLAAIAGKGVKELTYHRDYSAQWVVRLGDGTELSHRRMQAALDGVWPLLPELFDDDPDALAGVEPRAVDVVLDTVFATGGLDRPATATLAGVGGRAGRDGVHTEELGYVLAELQSVARQHPDATW
ncbi:ring-1,2-phenylacetyl-CoA epoxidase subunit PaaC [Jatrophihabitans endophyticus]|uniref:Ring-1,2-phenylacetyl-CoA epoxidase subunit PaaC n=1 Tax=Jatrophihabitans endophyticus TaxID=1206085 RepID=A0A1M5CGP1_9ACTN|nr:1,2-phenylacetyl-CoA epoxidase subunit PaaC [Jatrophihabitans endophyticus]SHF53841.1 ring-1,2-phenylacetyl-CoA epoxidase subunit PaaC [Jatrophihabitans endophyticus]